MKIGTAKELNVTSDCIAKFYHNEWKRPIALSDQKFYQWQFLKVPYQSSDACCIAIDLNGKLIGAMGINERKFLLNQQEYIGAELTTWVVSTEYRNKGIGPTMIDYIMQKYEILVGMGISNDALPVYLRKGFKFLRAIPRFIKVLNWDKIDKIAEYSPLAKKYDKYYKTENLHCFTKKDATETLCNSIFSCFCKTNNLFSRKFDYIEWRYKQHPFFNYEISVIFDQNNPGYGVFIALRIEKISSYSQILHIVDFYGDTKDFYAAIHYIYHFARENDVDLIDFFSTNTNINSLFIDEGWFSTLDHDFFLFPHLFQPIELRSPATTSLIYWSKTNEMSAYDFGKMYITKQDADFDRPVLKEKK